MRIVLWRHGQTDWNVENRFQGHSDIPLNAVGLYQASHAAKILAGMDPKKIIASDLMRAQQTATALAQITGLSVITEQGLRETNGGHWEGKTGAENREIDGEAFTQWILGGDEPAGTIGERRSEVANRVVAAIEKHHTEDEGDLIVVTHGGAVRCALGKILELPMGHWAVLGGLSNACWSVVERTRTGWSLIEHNAGSIPEPVFGNESSS